MNTLTKLALAAWMVASILAVPAETKRATEQRQPVYVAAADREPFHKPNCEWAQKISEKNRETFNTRDEATKAGHRPCKICRP